MGPGLIAGSPGGSGSPSRVTIPDTFAGAEDQARALRREPNRHHDQRAMGHVGIVAGVLDDAGAGDVGVRLPARLPGSPARTRASAPSAGRPARDREGAGQQRLEGGAGRAAGAGARRPPAPQWPVRLGLAHWRLSSSRPRPCLGAAARGGRLRRRNLSGKPTYSDSEFSRPILAATPSPKGPTLPG